MIQFWGRFVGKIIFRCVFEWVEVMDLSEYNEKVVLKDK